MSLRLGTLASSLHISPPSFVKAEGEFDPSISLVCQDLHFIYKMRSKRALWNLALLSPDGISHLASFSGPNLQCAMRSCAILVRCVVPQTFSYTTGHTDILLKFRGKANCQNLLPYRLAY